MNIIETGIVIKDLKECPVDHCVGFQEIAVCNVKGKWTTIGYEVLQYCIRSDTDPRQRADLSDVLPCMATGRCVWADIRKKRGITLLSQPIKESQLSFDIPFEDAS